MKMANKIRLIAELSSAREFEGGSERRNVSVHTVHADSSTETTYKLPAELGLCKKSIKQAMILSAGLGSRMGIHTKEVSKSMLLVDGISLIERHLLYLAKNDIKKVVINTFYKAQILENFILNLPVAKELDIHFSREEELLGTGGGIKNALPILGKEPFFLINNDAMFLDQGEVSAFRQLELKWQPDKMNILILLADKNKAFGFRDKGDFNMDQAGRIALDKEHGAFIHAGMRIMDYRAFENFDEKIFQLIPVYIKFMNEKRLYGTLYKGRWMHIGDNQAYEQYHEVS